MRNSILNIGVDIGGTNTKFGLVDERGKIIQLRRISTLQNTEPKVFLNEIIENIVGLIKYSGISINKINSIGIGIPGTVDVSSGSVIFAPNIFWENVEIIKILKKKLDINIFIAQDSRASAWGEFLFGAGQTYHSFASITLGTGVGCGIINKGKILNGGLNTAGEFGHQLVKLNGNKCNCGKQGCIEAYIGGRAILNASLKNKRLKNALAENFDHPPTVANIYSLAESGNIDALQITKLVWQYLGIGLVNLFNLLSPQLISISGGISKANDALLYDPLIEFVQKNAYSPVPAKVKIVRSTLNDNAPLIGASMLYKQS